MAENLKCAVKGCNQDAYVEVILYDVYPERKTVFFERDFTCPYLCANHMAQNETGRERRAPNLGGPSIIRSPTGDPPKGSASTGHWSVSRSGPNRAPVVADLVGNRRKSPGR